MSLFGHSAAGPGFPAPAWFLPPRRLWRRLSGTVPPWLTGSGDGPPDGRGPRRRRYGGGSGRWPLWLAVAAVTALAALLTLAGMVLNMVAGDAGPPYPPGP